MTLRQHPVCTVRIRGPPCLAGVALVPAVRPGRERGHGLTGTIPDSPPYACTRNPAYSRAMGSFPCLRHVEFPQMWSRAPKPLL